MRPIQTLTLKICAALSILIAVPATAQNLQPSITDYKAACDGVTDDSLAVKAATTALAGTGAAIHIPYNCRLLMGPAARLAGLPPVLDGVGLVGDGGRDSGGAGGVYGNRGGTLLLTDTGGPAFIVKRNWRFQGLIFDWPTQLETPQGTPRAMPAMITGLGGSGQTGGLQSEVSSGRFIDNDVVNAFVLMDFSADPTGGLQIRDNRIWCLDTCLRLRLMPLESWVSGNQFSPNADYNALGVGIGPTYHLRDMAAAQGTIVHIVGDGTAMSPPSMSVDGLSFSDNTVFGMGYALRISGGWSNLMTMTDNRLDGMAHVISLETGSRITYGTISGGVWYSYTFGSPSVVTTPITASPSAAANSSLSVDNVTLASSSGGIMDWRAPASDVSLTNIRAIGLNNIAGGTAAGVHYDSAGGRLRVLSSIVGFAAGSTSACIEIPSGLQMMAVSMNQFVLCPSVISLSGSPGAVLVNGNQAIGTSGPKIYSGPNAGDLPDTANGWDKPTR